MTTWYCTSAIYTTINMLLLLCLVNTTRYTTTTINTAINTKYRVPRSSHFVVLLYQHAMVQEVILSIPASVPLYFEALYALTVSRIHYLFANTPGIRYTILVLYEPVDVPEHGVNR